MNFLFDFAYSHYPLSDIYGMFFGIVSILAIIPMILHLFIYKEKGGYFYLIMMTFSIIISIGLLYPINQISNLNFTQKYIKDGQYATDLKYCFKIAVSERHLKLCFADEIKDTIKEREKNEEENKKAKERAILIEYKNQLNIKHEPNYSNYDYLENPD